MIELHYRETPQNRNSVATFSDGQRIFRDEKSSAEEGIANPWTPPKQVGGPIG